MTQKTARRILLSIGYAIAATDLIVFCLASHRSLWIIGLTGIIPVAAAILGGFTDPASSERSLENGKERAVLIRIGLILAGGLLQIAALVLLFLFAPRSFSLLRLFFPVVFSPMLILIAVFPFKQKAKF